MTPRIHSCIHKLTLSNPKSARTSGLVKIAIFRQHLRSLVLWPMSPARQDANFTRSVSGASSSPSTVIKARLDCDCDDISSLKKSKNRCC